MSAVHRNAGAGHLGIEMVSGQSAATSVWAVSPLKILIPRARGPSVWACLSTLGGGLVSGDAIAVTLNLGEGARCYLGTQASTKVYRNSHHRPCTHQINARLGPGSILALLPDPVQAFGGSTYRQQQEFWLAPGSGLVLVDWLCSGRPARGERWAFARFQSRNQIWLDGSRVLIDSLLLDPAGGDLDGSHRMGRFNCLALVAVIGGPFQAAGTALLDTIARLPVLRRAPLVCSASPIAQGALIRLAGEGAEAVGNEVRRLLAFLPQFLNDDPWSRKW